jgi:NitT/TauT family transport system substrate-binding protein
VFPVSDTGFNPYTTVLAISGDNLRKDPETAKKMTAAVKAGWQAYLDNPKPTNEKMHTLNPSMEMDTFAEVAEAQKPYIQTGVPLGTMTVERWGTLAKQLVDLGDIPSAPKPEECFRSLLD